MKDAMAVKWDVLKYAVGKGLDLGCGDSRPQDWMIGIDGRPGNGPRGPNIIADCRPKSTRGPGEQKVQDLSMFADGSQDYVFSSHLLQLLEQWPLVLAEWWRLVRQDGYLVLFLPVTETCTPKALVDAMVPQRPWQLVEATISGDSFFQVYRKCDRPNVTAVPDTDKTVAVVKLGAHGDALWASSVFPLLKEQGYHVILYTQETGEEVLRHDPHIDELIRFESRVPVGELGEFFLWLEAKYRHTRILVETVEGTLLPSPSKIQYHFPVGMRAKLMNFNYLEMHHMMAQVPMRPRVTFYPSDEEKRWANEEREKMGRQVVVLVPNGSSCSKMWPHAGEFAKRLLMGHDDVTLIALGDQRGMTFEGHPRLMNIGLTWDVRRAMTMCQLADVVVGQETGLLNCVSFEPHVHKVVLFSHSSVENLTRDWPNTTSIRKYPECAGDSGCHRLHYDWKFCNRDAITQAAMCQAMIPAFEVLEHVSAALAGKRAQNVIPIQAAKEEAAA